ncbi:MAG: hypothetical protein AOA65_1537 [Candidatus Bathyarchaeota archaeon BA1]|nr:MAG: hypothetical protein AOA65_1537 [Candidatus Bathyarchaeota archaeon BA1]
MKARKTIKAKIVHLTKVKQRLLEEECGNLQHFLHGENAELYSANKQQAKRFYKKIKPSREYPLSIRKDLIKIERQTTKIAEYWARGEFGLLLSLTTQQSRTWKSVNLSCLSVTKAFTCT